MPEVGWTNGCEAHGFRVRAQVPCAFGSVTGSGPEDRAFWIWDLGSGPTGPVPRHNWSEWSPRTSGRHTKWFWYPGPGMGSEWYLGSMDIGSTSVAADPHRGSGPQFMDKTSHMPDGLVRVNQTRGTRLGYTADSLWDQSTTRPVPLEIPNHWDHSQVPCSGRSTSPLYTNNRPRGRDGGDVEDTLTVLA